MADATANIFLSYAGHEPFVRAVAAQMRLQGIDPWFDGREIIAGTRWPDEVARVLAASDVVVVFIGAASDSPWFLFEIGAAVGGRKKVVPVYLTEGAMRTAPAPLTMFQGIDAHDQTPEQVAHQIAQAIDIPA